MSAYIGWIKAAIIVALLAALSAFIWRAGANSVRADWREADAARAMAEKAAVLNRVNENQEIFRKQERDSERIANAHKNELDKVRSDIARAPGLRVGPGICSGFAGRTETKGATGGDGSDSGTRALPEALDRDIKALIEETERVAAAGRAAQDFIRSNGMAP